MTSSAATTEHPNPVLELSALSCVRDGRTLFHDLNLNLAAGELCQLLGANGSGKSTLLRCVAGLYPDYEGQIQALPLNYVGHRLALNPLLTAADNLAWYAALAGVEANQRHVETLLAEVGLTGYGPMAVSQLSAGQQRRVSLARLKLVPASLWLLDEPLTALDTSGQALVIQLLEAHLARGGTALCATHQAFVLADGQGVNRTLTLGQAIGRNLAPEIDPVAGDA